MRVTQPSNGDDHGGVHAADAVIVTIPIGALGNVEFSPGLPQPRQKIVDEGTNSTGFKIWIKIDGHHNFLATAPTGSPIAMTKSEVFPDEGTTILAGFGPDHTKINLQDSEQVQQILHQWRPDLTVLESDGHDRCADQWSDRDRYHHRLGLYRTQRHNSPAPNRASISRISSVSGSPGPSAARASS